MLYKDDWEKCKERFDAFWEGEVVDRCSFAVTAPKDCCDSTKSSLITAKDLEQKWMDKEFRYNYEINRYKDTYYGAEAFPNFFVNLGPGVLSSFVGSPYVLGENTIWFDNDPIIKQWESMPDIKFHKDSVMWKTVYDMTKYFCSISNERYFVSMTDLGGTLDILATLRGTENILCDLYDYPEEVKELINTIDGIWISCYKELNELSNKYIHGSGGWVPTWCSTSSYPIQCDLSVMISPALFEEFVIPSLVKQSSEIEKCIYHLDGPGQLKHIDRILDIDTIDAIEWVHLPENGRITTGNEIWYPLYRKIQEKGKKVIIRDVDPRFVEKLLSNVSHKGIFFTTSVNTESEAKELIKKVESLHTIA